jgi:hypothetical protein
VNETRGGIDKEEKDQEGFSGNPEKVATDTLKEKEFY